MTTQNNTYKACDCDVRHYLDNCFNLVDRLHDTNDPKEASKILDELLNEVGEMKEITQWERMTPS